MDWVIDRLSEPSTWRGILLIMTGGASAAVSPELITHVVTTGLTLTGFLGAVSKDK